MIWIAYAMIYAFDLAFGCWLLSHDHPTAGEWVCVLSFIFGGYSLYQRIKKELD